MFQANFSIDAVLSRKLHSVLGLTAQSLSLNINLLNVDEQRPGYFNLVCLSELECLDGER